MGFSHEHKAFLVPYSLVDKQMINECSELQLKVLLLTLAYKNISIGELAEHLGVLKFKIEQSLEFWRKNELLGIGSELDVEKFSQKTKIRTAKLATKEITKIISESSELSFIVQVLPEILGRMLNQFDLTNLVNFNLNLGMPPEIILHLVKYCASEGRISAQAIKKEAEFWFECSVNSLEKAEEYIKRGADLNELHELVKSEMNLGLLDNRQKLTISKWKNKFELSMIKKACEIARAKPETSNVAYINGILNNWRTRGFKTLKDVNVKGQEVRKTNEAAPVFSPLLQELE